MRVEESRPKLPESSGTKTNDFEVKGGPTLKLSEHSKTKSCIGPIF